MVTIRPAESAQRAFGDGRTLEHYLTTTTLRHPLPRPRRLPLRLQNPVFEVWPTATCHITAGYRLRLVGTALKVTNHPHPFNPPKALFLVVVVGGGRGLWWAVRVPVVNPATRRPGGNVRPHQPASFSHNTRGLAALMVKKLCQSRRGEHTQSTPK